MACDEKKRLVSEYEAASKKFAASVTELRQKMGTSPKASFGGS